MSAPTKVKPEQLGTAISDVIREYTDDVIRELPEACQQAAKKTVKALKSNASKIGGTGAYRKSFKSKKTAGDSNITTYTVYSTKYRIAHLLEHGHVIKNQTGRVYGVTAAKPHWAPAEQEGMEELEKLIEEAAQK